MTSKITRVTPIFMGGNEEDLANYNQSLFCNAFQKYLKKLCIIDFTSIE